MRLHRIPSTLLAVLLTLVWLAGDASAQVVIVTAPGPVLQLAGDATPAASKKRKKKKKAKKGTKKGDPPPPPDDAAGKKGAAPPAPDDTSMSGMRRSNRMEFDARLVQGERPDSGAVYLFQRAPRRLPALVKLRQSYLREIVEPVLGVKHLVRGDKTGKRRARSKKSKQADVKKKTNGKKRK